MTVTITRPLIECLLRLQLDEFGAFREHLKAMLAQDTTSLLRHADENSFRRVQGHAQAVTEILELIDQAPSLADKMRGR